jgi:ParB family chromosome partitioning protein
MMATTALVQYDRARQALAMARSIDEVKKVRDQAEALRLYVRQQGEGLEMQNDIAEIKLRAERRAGELLSEMDRAQGVRTDLTSCQGGTKFAETLEELEIPKRTAYRWQAEATIPDEIFEQHVAETKAAGEELTSIGVYRLARRLDDKPHVSHNSGNNEWYTPPEYIKAARQVMGDIDLDPASSKIANQTVQAATFYTQEDDGLLHDWAGRVWMNPPYASHLIGLFVDKLAEHVHRGDITEACVLVNNATETGWFSVLLDVASCVCFIRSRVKFLDIEGKPSGAPLQGQAILYIGANVKGFTEAFASFGTVLYARQDI